ncbi:MAG: ClpXP protease specificity-enhancing factor [Halieaceae bacterium]|nr:ClpXP protease specificity-enhancing factor [Halieaceae bacterium]MCP5187776.1 ClpXP protease specificity-enhancing factor [Pseudomonadales bacterium]
MTPSRPYIMRALYEWIVDNDGTPYVLVDATVADVMVPQKFVKDGQIVLNISPGAVMELNIGNDAMVFNGRFGGVATDIYVPIGAVIGIYARENGQGMVFEPEESTGPPDEPPPDPIKPEGRPSLKIVK